MKMINEATSTQNSHPLTQHDAAMIQVKTLKRDCARLTSQRIDMLSHQDFDSVLFAIESYLPTIQIIGNQKANGKRFFKTNLIKKIEKQLSDLYLMHCDFEGERNWESWCNGKFQFSHQKIVGTIKQLQVIIENAVLIYFEGYLKCSYRKQKTLFSAESMIKDVMKAVDYLPDAWEL